VVKLLKDGDYWFPTVTRTLSL